MFYGCKVTKNVPDGKYLVKKNVIIQKEDKLDSDDIASIIRQRPNKKSLGVKWKLMAFNAVDSAKVARKRLKKDNKLRQKNRKRMDKQVRVDATVNQKRIARVRKRNEKFRKKADRFRSGGKEGKAVSIEKYKIRSDYIRKVVPLKDTINKRRFFREWLKYKYGEPPVVFDSVLYEQSIEQIGAFLINRGYYFGEVSGSVRYKKNKKAIVTYEVKSGKPYIIDSLYVVSKNSGVDGQIKAYLNKKGQEMLMNKRFDKNYLEDFRNYVAQELIDGTYYGFKPNYIKYYVDTNNTDMTVSLGLYTRQRLIIDPNDPDTVLSVPFRSTGVRKVYFHLSDTLLFKGDFVDTMNALGIDLRMERNRQFLNTIDTLYYAKVLDRRKSSKENPVLDKKRKATFLFNGKPYLKPEVLEMQNYLEESNKYKDTYTKRSYSALQNLNLFETIKMQVTEINGADSIDVHYYLKPKKRRSFSFSPKGTNSNGFLGASASLSYSNRNLFRGGEELTLQISGGFESQPPLFDENTGDQSSGRTFNTFEIGPTVEFKVPGLFPFPIQFLGKRQKPSAKISLGYNFQNRADFNRHTAQFTYVWSFLSNKTQKFDFGLPGISVLKIVRMNTSPTFTNLIKQTNNPFLLNTYSDQFVWQDWQLGWLYDITKRKNRTKKTDIKFKMRIDPAGNILSLFDKNFQVDSLGRKLVAGIPYSQFVRGNADFVIAQPFSKKHSIHFRFLVGGGMPYGNSKNALPYDYSFFGGGSNDNRGFRSRTLGPGSYKYYLDDDRTSTQVGDVHLNMSLEYRFAITGTLKGAVFADAGNIWTVNYDPERIGSQIGADFYKELAFSAGVGLRLDFSFFVFRVDLGIPLHNPAITSGSDWIWDSRDAYWAEAEAQFGANYRDVTPRPFRPQLHFGIGYPF